MNKEFYDPIALLLAAEKFPHLQEEASVQEARSRLQTDPSFLEAFNEAKDFFQHHQQLIHVPGLPEESRERIREALLAAQPAKKLQLKSWSLRSQLAWAAVLVLLLGGLAMMSSQILGNRNRDDQSVIAANNKEEFRKFVQKTWEEGFELSYQNSDPNQLVSWVQNQGWDPMPLPPRLQQFGGIGCTRFPSPQGEIALICFDRDGQTLHLFIVSNEERFPIQGPRLDHLPDGRPSLEWSDRQNAYILIPNGIDEELPEQLL